MASVQGNDSNNSLTGTLGNDTIEAFGGNDTINALDGNDAISDGLGSDIVNAGSGNDTITNVGGRDTIDGGPGDDWVVTDLSPEVIDPLNIAPWSFELGLDLATGYHGRIDGSVGVDSYSDIENYELIGDFSADLRGDDVNNVIIGGNGNDTIAGRGGADTLNGGSGNDIVYGGLEDTFTFEGTDFTTSEFQGAEAELLNDLGIYDALKTFQFKQNDVGDMIAFAYEHNAPDLLFVHSVEAWNTPSNNEPVVGQTEIGYEVFVIEDDGSKDYVGWIYESNYHVRPGLFGDLSYKHRAYSADKFDLDTLTPMGLEFMSNLGMGDSSYTFDDVVSFSLSRRILTTADGSETIDLHRITHLDANDEVLGGMEANFETNHVWRMDKDRNTTYEPDFANAEALLDEWSQLVADFVDSVVTPYDDGQGADLLSGGAGNDMLFGGFSNDTLNGESGNDTLDGDSGNDMLMGGLGNDEYRFAYDGNDTISDAGGSDDVLFLTARDAAHRPHWGDNYFDDGNLVFNINEDRNQSSTLTIQDAIGSGRIEHITYHADSGQWDDFTLRIAAPDDNVTTANIAFFGTLGNDVVTAVSGYNEAYMSAGNDNITMANGGSFVFAGDGNDTLRGGAGNDSLYGQDNDDVIYGGAGNDSILGGAGNDNINGGDGNDWQHGGGGQDTMTGGAGTDSFVILDQQSHTTITDYQPLERIVFNTPFGFDEMRYAEQIQVHYDANEDVTLVSTSIGASGPVEVIRIHGEFEMHSVTLEDDKDIELKLATPAPAGAQSIIGTENADRLDGDDGNDTIAGLGGNDSLLGHDGNDSLIGGAGNDNLLGGAGIDTLDGGEGDDRVNFWDTAYDQGVTVDLQQGFTEDKASGEKDVLINIESASGTDANDTLIGDNNDNGLDGNDGDDVLYGHAGKDSLWGRKGNDTIYGGDDRDFIIGFAGDDYLDGGEGDDKLRYDKDAEFGGTNGVSVNLENGTATDGFGDTDTIIGFYEVQGSASNDTLIGDNSSNRLDGQDGDDSLVGQAGDDYLNGGNGNDTLDGGDGRDRLWGDAGNDVIDASKGSASSQDYGDIVSPGLGNDTIIGHQEASELGERGEERDNGERYSGLDLLYDDLDASHAAGIVAVITDDTLGAGFVESRLATSDPLWFRDTFTYVDRIEGTQFDDIITGSNQYIESFVGEAGNDTIDGGGYYDDSVSKGFDTIDYRYENSQWDTSITARGVIVDLANNTATDTFGDTDTLYHIDGVFGSHLDDSIVGNDRNNYLIGGDGSDVIQGGDGDDQLDGGAGNDVLRGGNGNDTLVGGTGNVQIFGEAGDDEIIQNGSGTQYYDGGEGNDTYVTKTSGFIGYNGFVASVNLSTGFSGIRDNTSHRLNDRVANIENIRIESDWLWELIGDSEDNVLISGSGNDTLWGLAGNDTLIGGAGDDVVSGGSGRDVVVASAGNDAYFGGRGEDVLDLSQVNSTGIILNSDAGTVNGQGFGTHRFDGFEGFVGTSANDTMTGRDTSIGTSAWVERNAVYGSTDNYELFRADKGNDTIDGAGGYDEVSYGAHSGDLVIDLRVTNQDLYGDRSEIDVLRNIEGVEGSNGNDTITGNDASNSLDGRFGNNVIDGADGVDFVEYNGAGRVNLVVNLATGSADFTRESNGEEYRDQLKNIEGVIGSNSDDDITGDNGNNILYGVKGDDTILGGLGDDTMSGGAGNDLLNGGAGRDVFLYNAGDGNDTIVGFNFADDTINSDLTYRIFGDSNAAGGDAIALFSNGAFMYFEDITDSGSQEIQTAQILGNTLAVSDAEITSSNAIKEDVTSNIAFETDQTTTDAMDQVVSVQRTQIDLSQANDTGDAAAVSLTSMASTDAPEAIIIDLGSADNNNLERTIEVNSYKAIAVVGEARIRGGEGDNTFIGDSADQDVMLGAGDDYLSAGAGNDTIGSAGGDDTVLGGTGNDFVFGGIGNDSVNGGTGNDHISDAIGSDMLIGGEGNDTIRSFDGGDTIDAGLGNDVVYGGRSHDDISGGDGDDVLFGDTVLFASRGNDTIDGGQGNDTMQGGYGADTFIFRASEDGNNIITRIDGGGRDFEIGSDVVELHGFADAVTSETVMTFVTESASGNAQFRTEGVTIEFDGISVADLSASDFDIIA